MFIAAIACAIVIGVNLVLMIVPTALFCWRLRTANALAEPQPQGKFCIGLPLRGADPKLEEAIQRILEQDYPDFELHIVVDSRSDPAWEIAHSTIRRLGVTNVKISALETRSRTCSRYCSALAQYVSGLDESCKFVGFADGDMIVPKDWLRLMAQALSDEAVGATLGNRWYVPVGGRWGTLVRYLWNAGAVVPMWLFEMPWTGAMALRYETVCKIGLAEKLRRGMTEDAPVKEAIDRLGLKFRFIPQLMIPNCEEANLPHCFGFIQRQLLWTKLYHPHWWYVVFDALLRTALMFLPIIGSAALLASGNLLPGAIIGASAACHSLGLLALLGLLETSMRQTIERGRPFLPGISWLNYLRLALAIPLSQLIHTAAVFSCIGKRTVSWRGVQYRINGPWDICVIAEDNTTPSASQGQGAVSLS